MQGCEADENGRLESLAQSLNHLCFRRSGVIVQRRHAEDPVRLIEQIVREAFLAQRPHCHAKLIQLVVDVSQIAKEWFLERRSGRHLNFVFFFDLINDHGTLSACLLTTAIFMDDYFLGDDRCRDRRSLAAKDT